MTLHFSAIVERASGDELAALAPIILELLEILDPHVTAPMYRAVRAHGGYARTIIVPEVDVDVVALARFVARRRMDETAPNDAALEPRADKNREEGR